MEFLAQLIIFILATFFIFIVPGLFLLNKTQIETTPIEKLTLATIIGFCLFTFLGYILLVINKQLLIIPIIITLNILSLKLIPSFKNELFSVKLNSLVLIIFLFGLIGQLAVIAPSGIKADNNLLFWSSHAHDYSWHLSLVNEMKRGYPMQMPSFSGERLLNYHFFSDIAPAYLSKFLFLNDLDLYFRLFPLLYSLLFGGIIFFFSNSIFKSFPASLWAVSFSYFAGSFGFLITIFRNGNISGEALFGASQVQSTIGNPPQIAASIILLTSIFLLTKLLSNFSKTLFSLVLLLTSSLFMFKAYAGLLLIFSLLIVGFWQLISKRHLTVVALAILSGIITLILYLPNSFQTTSFLNYDPLWFIRKMVVAEDKLNWLDLENKRQTYLSENNFKRVLQIELISLSIFLFGNLGTRFIALSQLLYKPQRLFQNSLFLLLFTISLTSFLLPVFFSQKGVASNVLQFLQYFLLITGIVAGITTYQLLKLLRNKYLKISLGVIIILLTIPTQLGLLYEFYKRPAFAKINQEELQALNFMKHANDGVILNPSYNRFLQIKDSTPPIWAWSDTAYLTAFTNKRTFLSDTEQVDIMGYDYLNRLKFQNFFFTQTAIPELEKLLTINNIKYIYFPKAQKPQLDLTKTKLSKIFENRTIEIWATP